MRKESLHSQSGVIEESRYAHFFNGKEAHVKQGSAKERGKEKVPT